MRSATGLPVTYMNRLWHPGLCLCCLCRLSRSHPWKDVDTELKGQLWSLLSVWMTLHEVSNRYRCTIHGRMIASRPATLFSLRAIKITSLNKLDHLAQKATSAFPSVCMALREVNNRHGTTIHGRRIAAAALLCLPAIRTRFLLSLIHI